MRKIIAAVAIGAAMTFGAASAANAALTGFTLDMGGSLNSGKLDMPVFKLSNISDLASLTQFSLTFGPSIYNVDRFTNPNYGSDVNPKIGISVVTPDTIDNTIRDDGVVVNFTNFAAGDALGFALEFDLDSNPNSTAVDTRSILWNNGDLANAVLKVTFSDGTTLTQTLPDSPANQRTWTFSGQSLTSAVPEPATWAMMIAGFGLAGAALRRRQTSANAAI